VKAFTFQAFRPEFMSIIEPHEAQHGRAKRLASMAVRKGDSQMNFKIFGRFGSGNSEGAANPLFAGVLILALLLGACGDKEPATPAAGPAAGGVQAGGSAEVVPGADTSSAVIPATVPELLSNASAAFSQDRLVAPEGDNAIEYYLAVLNQEKDNVQATQGLVDLFPLGVSIAEKEIAARNVDEATRIIALLDESSPGSYTVQKLKSRLAAQQNLIQREDERRLAAEQAQLAAQQRSTAAAADPAPATTTTSQPVSTASTTPRETRPAVTETEAAPPPVSQPTTPARPTGETRDAKVVRQVQPGYPQLAYRRRLTGWVEIRFNVGTEGRVSNVEVIRADPPRMFDREAIRAVEQWMFEPALRDGQPVPSTLSRRIEFKYPG
jgi:periplasmic protein TonB